MAQDKVPFLDMFAIRCAPDLKARLAGAGVISAAVDRQKRSMKIELSLPADFSSADIGMVKTAIAEEFGLAEVELVPVFRQDGMPSKTAKKTAAAPRAGKVLIGKPISGKPTPMCEVGLESGKVVIQGEIFEVESREIAKRNAYVLSFDMTDYTGSLRVSKFIVDDALKSAAKKISVGMYVTVSGFVGYNRYDGDITVEPQSIVLSEKKTRQDLAEEKRVELHLHTKMSALDALTDVGEAIKRAASWGHRAVAITDHGVCHSFPEAMAAAGDKIKVLYGVEGYYINDVDDKLSYCGEDMPLDSEIAVFDIETTGLDPINDAVTEIGAVIMRNGQELGRFQTFVDPERHIPASVTQLTGISDEDVSGAPKQAEAVKAFLDFVGGRPIAAHNATFDIAFISRICEENGIPFEPSYVDTMPICQGMLPEIKSHRLNVVSDFLGLPEFNHHRAADDAVMAGLVMSKLFPRIAADGVTTLRGMNEYIQARRRENAEKRRFRPMHIIIIAKTQAGIKNLYKLVTKSHLEHFKRFPIIPKSLLMEHREGLMIGSACEAGEVFSLVSDHRSRREQRRIAEFYDYLEIQPVCNNMFMVRSGKARDVEELRDFNRRVVELGEELGKPVVATGDVHFLDPEHEIYRHVLLSAKEYDDADKSLPVYFKTTDEMLEEFSYLGEEKAYEVVVKNTNLIADMCDNVSPLPPPVLYAPKIENSAEDLKRLVYEKMHELYGENPPETVSSRVETELKDILDRNYDVIYMSAQKLVADSLAHGYLVGSRGSVGSSIVAYMSGITEVNSLPAHYRCPKCKHADFESGKGFGCGADMPNAVCPVCGEKYEKDGFDIPFETFLGFGGDKVPDIDLNFSGEYQANAHKFTNTLFGADHVFKAGTIGTVAQATAFGYVRKYLERLGKTVTKAEELRLANGCVGVKRTTGQHPGGLVVIPQDMEICDFCPAQHPADDSDTDIITTHFDYHRMEANLLKLDELGHDDPTMIKMLEDMTGIDARKIPFDDPQTLAIFKSAEPLGLPNDDEIIGTVGTFGVPEFGTGFAQQMLTDIRPTQFNTLVRFVGFSHGTDVWAGNARELVTSKTASVDECVGCRDDIMLYLISLGMDEKKAFKIMEAVRKGKIKKNGFQDGWAEEMASLGAPKWYIDSLSKIAYLFPKAHAVAYVMMAFRIAWFKVHEPLAFYSAYFYRRSQKDAFDAEIMTQGIEKVLAKIREIRQNPEPTAKEDDLLTTLLVCYEFYKRGFEFLKIDLYKSEPLKFVIEGDKLRPPFVAIGGLGETAARDLQEQRDGKVFISVDELSASCTKVSKTHIEQLKTLGALGDMPETSQLSLF
ncbi:MAG: PolC-type DNA polymerase III [Oscillospiraceae bacterium]|nr:PolC-type DNA polymerase III [Oscillospiraceae bacterium]